MTERCISFDLEWSTRDYPSGVRDGDLVCLQWCELRADGTCGEPEVLPAWHGADRRARDVFGGALRSPSWVLLGQNVAGDVLKAALHWGLLREADEAYRQGRIRCTFLAQRLIDVAWPGRLVWVPLGGAKRKRDEVDLDAIDDSQEDEVGGARGFWAIKKYRPNRLYGREQEFSTDDDEGGRGARAKAGLDALAAVHLGLDIAADKKRGGDGWRMRYGELVGVPVADWPEEAYRYAAKDPVLTAQVRAAQVRRPPAPYAGPWCDVLYPPADAPPWAPLRCERFEAYAHFALEDMARLGLERDQPRVERMRATLQRAAAAAEGAAIRAGVVRLDVSRDMALVARLKADDAEHAPEASGLRDLKAAREIADRRDLASLEAFVADRPWIHVDRKKDAGEVVARAEALYRAAGWRELPRTDSQAVSASAEHLQQVVRPRDDADPDAAADLRELVGPDLLTHLQAWTDAGGEERIAQALDAANDPGLAAHMARQKCQTFDRSFLACIDERHRATKPNRWRNPTGPARFGFSPFKSTGRTGVRGDLRQNMPKSGGVRECFVPRRGRVLVAVDYSACEMSTLADVLDDLVLGGRGWSTLGQAIRAGDDCHLRLAATMRGEPYAQLLDFYKPRKKRLEAGDVLPAGELRDWIDIDRDRAGAKEGNFSFGGGAGARKFAKMQRKKGKDCTEDRARFIRDSWLECWSPEVPVYFGMASDATGDRRGRRSATVVHARGGHVRGGLDFCSWLNTHFQQRAAAGAKRAAIMLFRACRLDQANPLYGVADPALFVHDEFILEVDEVHADVALVEVRRLMEAGMSQVCATPVKTEGKILRERWSK